MVGVGSVSWFVALAAALGVLTASPPSARAEELSELEQRTLARALEASARAGSQDELDPSPQGKEIESVEIVRPTVFDDDDPVPDFVNWFHMQTREVVIRRELLFRDGDRYVEEEVQETLRNLQLIPQFGVVVIAPLRGSTPGRVRMLVIVRDVWSLRLNYDLQGSFSSIDYLMLNLSEDNFLGTRTRLGAVFSLEPDRYSLGVLVAYPRIAGTKLDALLQAGAYVNLDTGKPEGSYGSVSLRRDLLALRDKWSFLVGTAWNIEQTRLFQHRQPVLSEQGIPIEYASNVVRAGAEVGRSFGTSVKSVLTWGVELNRRDYQATRAPDTTPEDFAAFVAQEVPVSDTRLSPFVQLENHGTSYLATRNVETLELKESFLLGPVAALRLYPASSQLGSSRDLMGSVAWLSYTHQLGDGLARVVANSSIEAAEAGKQQAAAQGALRLVSPRFLRMRAVVDTALVTAYENYLNRKLVLGGESRPRGYLPSAFRGPSGFAGSFELRTSAVNVLSARIGAVAFYDIGGAGATVPDITLHQSVGAGVRVLFPQVNRICFRLDWGAPLTPGPGRATDSPLPGGVYFTFGQAFDMPLVKTPEILGAGTTLLELSQ